MFRDAGFAITSLNRTLRGEAWLGEILCDFRDQVTVNNALDVVLDRSANLDACVLSAGVRRLAPAAMLSEADIQESFVVNCMSQFRVAVRAYPALKHSRGTLVVVGSNATTRCFESGAAYSASKSAMATMAKTLDMEWRKEGVRVTLVVPGAIANRAKGHDDVKMLPESVGRCILSIVESPKDLAIGTIVVEPTKTLMSEVSGIDRLLYQV